jgi:hypothetical protein
VLAETVAAFSTRGGQVASHGVEKKDPTFYYAPHVGGPWASEALNFGCQHCRSVISWVWGAEISRGSLAALSIGVVSTASVLGGCKIRGVAMHCVATPPLLRYRSPNLFYQLLNTNLDSCSQPAVARAALPRAQNAFENVSQPTCLNHILRSSPVPFRLRRRLGGLIDKSNGCKQTGRNEND